MDAFDPIRATMLTELTGSPVEALQQLLVPV